MPKSYLLLLAVALALPAKAADIFVYGSEWKYFIGATEASQPDPTAWRAPGFDDSAWASGPTPIGYANPPNNPVESAIATLIPSTQDANYLSVFFRKSFLLGNPASVGGLNLNVNVDDGYIAWINGREVSRYNVPDGNLAFDANALSAGEATLVPTSLTSDLSSFLLAGKNTLAIQVFNANRGSSDLLVDVALSSDLDETPPTVTETTPLPGANVGELGLVEIVFSESVTGVDAGDLLVNGQKATNVTQISPRNYVFNFAQPAKGTVTVAWAAGHGIADLAPSPNPFPGGSWTYSFNPVPPTAKVVISEFMADNGNGIRDEDGARSDWLELFNTGSLPMNLDGWFLTDTAGAPTKWRLPAVSLDAGRYLVIWASGKDRKTNLASLHTNFKLGKSSGYLGLADANTNVVSQFAPTYPPQRTDVSYGRDPVNPTITGFFSVPTPGARNSTSGSGFAVEPSFSVDSGVYTNATLTVTLSAPAGEIRYTMDGTPPTASSPIYSAPISVSASVGIKARVYQSGLLPSDIVGKSYVLVDRTVATFSSNLPLMILDTQGQGIVESAAPGDPRTFASLVTIDGFRGRTSPTGRPDYIGFCEMEGRGQTSAGFPKRPYNVEVQDNFRNDFKTSLLGMPANSDWVMYNPYSDKPFLQNFLAYELFEKMGHYSVRRKFVEVFVNYSGGKVVYPRDYQGIYILVEKIKADPDRVDIAKLTPGDNTEPNISGGYMFKKDKDSAGDIGFSTAGGAGFSGQYLKIHEPKPREITTQQLTWLNNYLNQFEKALYASNWKTATGPNHYSYYMDSDSFVDYHWIVEFAKQIDGYRLSNYMQKDRNGKIKMEPIWDWNLSFGNADYLDGSVTSGWYYSLLGDGDHIWLRRLITGTTSPTTTSGDPDFNQKIADRWGVLRTNIMNSTNVLARVDQLAAMLNEAAVRDFAKWPRLGQYVWPNPSFYVTPTTYAGIITSMKNWIRGRFNWIETQFVKPPILNLPEGPIPPGVSLTMASGFTPVYYTLDGSDPRASGGAVAAGALLYGGPVTVNANARVVARAKSGAKWSGPTAATLVVARPTLTISEIMYHPPEPPSGSPFARSDFEFIEFKNTGPTALNLKGFAISDGVDFTFPDYTLGSGERVLVVKNRIAFQSRYGAGLPIAGEYLGSLSSSSERIVVKGSLREPVLDFSYSQDWQPVTDGLGFSLELADESVAPELLGDGATWRASSAPNGTPGAADGPAPAFPRVVVSEIVGNPTPPAAAKIELRNLSASPANIGGWFLSDDSKNPRKYRVADGTTIPAGGFAEFAATEFSNPANPGALAAFNLNPLGGEVWLFSGNADGGITGYRHGFKFGAQSPDASLGRHIDSTGGEHFVEQVSATIGRANSGPAVGPIVIGEIMYRPPDVLANGSLWNNSEDEFVELFNRTDKPVPLFDAAHATNSWKVKGDIGYTFPPNASLPALGRLLVVNFDPALDTVQLAAFRSKFGVSSTIPLFGPYSGNLGNGNGAVSLWRPGEPVPAGPDAGTVPEILVERIAYDDNPPWPSGADGLDHSLQRANTSSFGNDPENWLAAPPTAGAATASGAPPVIITQPASQMAHPGDNVKLEVSATGQGPLRYQWRFNGDNLAYGTNATLVVTNAQPAQSGEYLAVALSPGGSTTSLAAKLTIETDSDNDGIPNAWELANGGNPFDPADASADPDGDGISNLLEYRAGTNPRDPQSRLKLDTVAVAGTTRLAFQAMADRSYTVQYSDTLAPASWVKLADIGSREKAFAASVEDANVTGQRFYRLVTPRQP